MTHHPLGMSRWTPWSVCPRFDSVDNSPTASIGISAHEKLNSLLRGEEVALDTSQQVDRAVSWAYEEILKARDSGISSTLFTEHKVFIHLPERFGLSDDVQHISGTVDAYVLSKSANNKLVIDIFDFKSLAQGGKDMWAQLKGYALGVASDLYYLGGDTELSITQEINLHLLLGGIFRHDILRVTLDDCTRTANEIIEKRKNKDTIPPCPSSWCKYCKHASSCKATDTQVELVKSGGLMSYSAPKRLVIIDTLEGILKKAKEEAREEIANTPNRMIEDDGIAFAITTKNGPSKLAENKAVDLFNACAQFGITADDFLAKCQLSKTDVIKLLASKGGLKQKSKNKDEVTAESIVTPFYVSKPVDKLERIK